MAMRSAVQIATRRQAREHPVVARLRERVLAALGDRVERIVLFGSRARGDEHAESDWDFAVFFAHDPSEREQRLLSDVTDGVQSEFGADLTIVRSGRLWRATDALSCNIRDHGRVAYGPAEIPMIERPVLQHARTAMEKAERFAELSHETPDDRFEGVIHGAYYAMFHAARAALLALESSASTNHGQVVKAFKQAMRRRRIKGGREHAAALAGAAELRMKADYSHEDLTEAGRSLRGQVRPFLESVERWWIRRAAAEPGKSSAAAATPRLSRPACASCCRSASIRTGARPSSTMPSARAAAFDRSMSRPSIHGPRSLITTVIEAPVLRWITLTSAPNGSSRCAAVSWFMSKTSPLAVSRPWNGSPYQEAVPRSRYQASAPSAGSALGTNRKAAPANDRMARPIANPPCRNEHYRLRVYSERDLWIGEAPGDERRSSCPTAPVIW